MSLSTWKKEFYPISASKCSKKNAAAHSLKKWEGLIKKNLKKHSLAIDPPELYDPKNEENSYSENCFEFNETTCSLCVKYYSDENWSPDNDDLSCKKCPLYKVLGNMSCTERGQPYYTFTDTGNPVPMINALKKVVNLEKKHK
jgi:hypothetical protein